MPVDHYENFPVASLLMPKRLRKPVEAIYRFARQADDLADEGDATVVQRREALAAYDAQLRRIAAGSAPAADPAGAMFVPLATEIARHGLPIDPFRDLLSAFSQDCIVTRYEDDATLLDYCRRSANPVGRLMLILYGADTEIHRHWSDRICTALQWINFWQDVAVDRLKDRIYLPLAELRAFGIDETSLMDDLPSLVGTDRWKNLMRHTVERTRTMMVEGLPLSLALSGRIGFELRMIVHGGLRILEKIEAVDYDVCHRRPTLGRSDGALVVWRALTMRRPPTRPAPSSTTTATLQSRDDA